MPSWLQGLLLPVAILAAFYLIAWGINRSALSRRVRIVGWAMVAVTVVAILWSALYETLLPCLHSGSAFSALLAVLQPVVMLLGVALALYGIVLFLRSMPELAALIAASAIVGEVSRYPEFRQEKWALRLKLIRALLSALFSLPSLGCIAIGIGVAAAAGQLLEPDRSLAPDMGIVYASLGLILGGVLQIWFAWRRHSRSVEEDDF